MSSGMRFFPYIVVFLLLSTSVTGAERAAAVIAYIEGDVEVRIAGGLAWQEARNNDFLKSRDKIRTKINGYSVIKMPAGARVELKESSVLDVIRLSSGEQKQVTKIKLWAGSMRTSVERNVSKYEIHTPVAVCRVNGTIVGVFIKNEHTAVFWLEKGSADITAYKSKEKKHISAGEMLIVDAEDNSMSLEDIDEDDALEKGWDRKPVDDAHSSPSAKDSISANLPEISIGKFDYKIIGQAIVIKESPSENPVTITHCPDEFELRLSVDFPALTADIPVGIKRLELDTSIPEGYTLNYKILETEGEIPLPVSSTQLKNIEIPDGGDMVFFVTDDRGRQVYRITKRIDAVRRVTVNGKVLPETSTGVFEDNINAVRDMTLEVEVYWLVNGRKMETYFDRSIVVRCGH